MRVELVGDGARACAWRPWRLVCREQWRDRGISLRCLKEVWPVVGLRGDM